jgi:hypothetical protein
MQSRASLILLLALALVSSFVVTGCSSAAVSKDADPLHVHLVCVASDDGEGLTCEGSERLAHFSAWINDALFRPGSTFTIWVAGPTRQGSRLFFAACIPPHWKPPVWKTKAAFLAGARQGALGSKSGLSVPENCRPPGPKASGSIRLAVSASASPLHADVWQKVASASTAPPLHLAVICDRSDSTDGAACNPSSLLRAFDLWTGDGLLLPGSTLSVEMVGAPRQYLRAVFHLTVPDIPIGERVAFVLSSRRELAQLLGGLVEKYASTIAEAISASVSRLRERAGRYQLVLLSDLLQISPGAWNFEASLPPPNDFIAWLRKSNLAPDLRDMPVLACGVHTGQSPGGNGPYTAAYAVRLRDLWERALLAMGAAQVRLFSSCESGFSA